MDPLELLVRRLPESERAISRRYWRSAPFREVCGDYRDMVEALAELERVPGHDRSRAAEFRQLANELLAEMITMLKEDRK